MFKNFLKKIKVTFITAIISGFLVSPVVDAEDIEIFFGEGKTANMMLVLDLSGSMALYPDGTYATRVNSDGIHIYRDGSIISANDEVIVKEFEITKNNIKFEDAVKELPSPEDNEKARYPTLQMRKARYNDDGDFVRYDWLDWIPWEAYPGYLDYTDLTKLPNGEWFRWYYKDNRITQLKEALFDFVGDSAVARDKDQIGMMTYSTGHEHYNRNPEVEVIEQVRPLGKVTGGITHRESLTSKIFNMWPTASTPTAEGYYRATQYLGGSYTQNGAAIPSPILDGACGFNNSIVLLTDGTPTAFDSNAHSSMEKIIGACDSSNSGSADSTNYGKQCTENLSAHYFVNDVKSNFPGSTVNTSTVAFSLNDNLAKTFLQNVATELNGEKLYYEPKDGAELAEVFKQILLSTQDSTSFVAPSVPLSQSNRLKHSNDLYMAMFKPEGKETWSGNLKKYSLKEGKIVDSKGVVAVDTNTGTFLDSAVSHWFTPYIDTDLSDGDDSILADGNEIELGGALPRITVGEDPKVYSNLNTNDLNQLTLDFTKNYVSNTDLSVLQTLFNNNSLTKVQAQENFDWVRNRVKGLAPDQFNRFGDALHSRPQILEYENKTVAFISTNQGYLHAIDTATGNELWSFIPRQLLKNVETWKGDQTFDPDNIKRRYGLDGQMHIHSFIDGSGKQKHHLYLGMRRGGNNIYALDISNEATKPSMLYTISDEFALTRNELGYNFEKRALIPNLAQSWGMPAVVKLPENNADQYAKRLVFSGGFDTYFDQRDPINYPPNPNSSLIKGNAIFYTPFYESISSIPNNITATTLANNSVIKNSIAANLTFIDINNDGVVEHIYASDVGGKIYRLDLFAKEANTIDVVADMGSDTTDHSYRFYAKPDVIFADYQGVSFATIVLGSGHRSDPKQSKSVDKFYAFFDFEITGVDKNTGDNDPILPADIIDVTSGTIDADGNTVFLSVDDIRKANKKGWYIKLAPGEKVLANSTTVDFNVFFTTFIPGQGVQCGVTSTVNRLYGVKLLDGAPSVSSFETGLLADPTDRYTNVNYVGIAPGVTILFPDDTSIATLVGTQTICSGDDCDFLNGGVRTVKWRQQK